MRPEAKGGACDERTVLGAGIATPESISHRSSAQVSARAAAPPCRTADCVERAATRVAAWRRADAFRACHRTSEEEPTRPNRQLSGRPTFDVRCQDSGVRTGFRTPVADGQRRSGERCGAGAIGGHAATPAPTLNLVSSSTGASCSASSRFSASQSQITSVSKTARRAIPVSGVRIPPFHPPSAHRARSSIVTGQSGSRGGPLAAGVCRGRGMRTSRQGAALTFRWRLRVEM